MNKTDDCALSVIVPVYNEATGLMHFHASLNKVLAELSESYEIIFVDDGSSDNTGQLVQALHQNDPRVKLLRLSRNFGKEYALSAGIALAQGRALLMIDGDCQHPVELIPQFIKAWTKGAQVVVGVRTSNQDEGWLKHSGSKYFYKLFNRMAGQKLVPGSSDYRLIDRAVQKAFLGLPEVDRITRGLIDWLGFGRVYIQYESSARTAGTSGYSLRKLVGLAANSFVSFTFLPLYVFGYLGVFITLGSLLLGVTVTIEQLILGDPWRWRFSGTAMLGILLLFLVGIVLMSQGILSLYISHLLNQSKQRPLYVIDYAQSAGFEDMTRS